MKTKICEQVWPMECGLSPVHITSPHPGDQSFQCVYNARSPRYIATLTLLGINKSRLGTLDAYWRNSGSNPRAPDRRPACRH